MIRFLNFIVEIRDIIILVFCILLSFLLMISSDEDPGRSLRRIVLNTIGSIGGNVYQIQSYFDLQTDIEELREQNVALAMKYMESQNALLENLRLRKLLDFRSKTDFSLIAAEVIGENPQSIINGFLLNKGSKEGIDQSDAVLTADGLVGRILRVDNNFSICQILVDRNSRVSAKIQRNRELGIIAWDGGSQLKLLYITKTIEVLVGDVIVTSGYSQIFPENIKVGVVTEVSLEKEGLFQRIVIQPAVNFNRIEEVFILKRQKENAE